MLSRIAYGGEGSADPAVDELGDLVCSLGFVVGEATAPTAPFLPELAGAPHVPRRAALFELLENIVRTEQWHSAAAAAGGPLRADHEEQLGWGDGLAGRPAAEAPALSLRPEEAVAARSLLRVTDAGTRRAEPGGHARTSARRRRPAGRTGRAPSWVGRRAASRAPCVRAREECRVCHSGCE